MRKFFMLTFLNFHSVAAGVSEEKVLKDENFSRKREKDFE
jgi:hypothetical protein